MLGLQSWYTALAVPTVLIGGFVATRKRLGYQWRDEVMDMENTIYPTITDADMVHIRQVSPARVVDSIEDGAAKSAEDLDEAVGTQLRAKDNIGLHVAPGALCAAMTIPVLNEVRHWAQTLGNPLDPRKIAAFEDRLRDAQKPVGSPLASSSLSSASSSSLLNTVPEAVARTEADFYGKMRVVSDHAEDIQLMKAPWGCGDRIEASKMPSTLRFLAQCAHDTFTGLGRLRHVYVLYSPTGVLYQEPKIPSSYDGHDYVVIPLRRDGNDTIITFSPMLRSKFALMNEVIQNSWTSRDVDACMRCGSMMRVYGTARYDWGWALRPGATTWFGSRLNVLDYHGMRNALEHQQSHRRWWQVWKASGSVDKDDADGAHGDAAVVVLHFEGPRSQTKQRSLFLHPEIWIYGKAPTVEKFETWSDAPPTAESVRSEGVLRFVIRNYFTMLNVS